MGELVVESRVGVGEIELVRPDVPGPCRGCGQAEECCSNVHLVFTPEQAENIPGWFLNAPNVTVIREEKEGYIMVDIEGVCPAFNRETFWCDAKGQVWRSDDCKRYPLDMDGLVIERLECPAWDKFSPQPVNCVVLDPISGALEVR